MNLSDCKITIRPEGIELRSCSPGLDALLLTPRDLSYLLRLLMQEPAASGPPLYKFLYQSLSDRGLNEKRTVNEDRLLALPEQGLFLVADGVGGQNSGEVASQLAVDLIQVHWERPQQGVALQQEHLRFLQSVNSHIRRRAAQDTALSGMATTLAMIHFGADGALVVHVGDSRVYRIRRQKLERLTADHTPYQETESDAARTPLRHVITRALGAQESVEPGFSRVDVQADDLYILTTDGVTDNVSDEQLQEIGTSAADLGEMIARVKLICFDAGARDNLTVIFVRVQAGFEKTTWPMFKTGPNQMLSSTDRLK